MTDRSASRASTSRIGISTSGRVRISGHTRASGRRQAIERGILVAGNPDTVYKQIMDIYDKVGGFAHFIFIGRSGFLTHEEANKGIRLMAKEVLPRLPAATITPDAVDPVPAAAQ